MISSSGKKYTQLPLHRGSRSASGPLFKLSAALEKGLDMAGVGRTKVGKGDKEKAYVVKTYTCLFFLLFSALLMFSGVLLGGIYYFDYRFMKQSVYHDLYVSHLSFQKAQHKATAAHLELQKTLNMVIRGTEQLEELRSRLDFTLGEMTNEVKSSVLPSEREAVEKVLQQAQVNSLSKVDRVLKQFVKRKTVAKTRLEQLSESVMDDIALSERETGRFKDKNKAFKTRKHPLSDFEKKDLSLGESEKSKKGLGHIDSNDAKELETSLNNFFQNFLRVDFPIINDKVLKRWTKTLQQMQKQLDDDTTATDLRAFRKFVEHEFVLYVPNVEIDIESSDESLMNNFERIILLGKLAPHKQELLDLYNGWQAGGLTVYQVLSNIERLGESEDINVIDLFNN